MSSAPSIQNVFFPAHQYTELLNVNVRVDVAKQSICVVRVLRVVMYMQILTAPFLQLLRTDMCPLRRSEDYSLARRRALDPNISGGTLA